ncbi:IclR family transcriptional regulator [Sporosarcina sp. Te-1]|uniref:IclR family transcriptional regulator n=1 Tax=Sporosarcina sp. Te-1 TaxID=2818390 RepID=UPI001A9DD884|nr:IclR family transcriptional regulator [Sporosarcina sp. Te-1]QTD40690.1 IclR family transcriptional regulator [Sporosarcina sp. Te-1]
MQSIDRAMSIAKILASQPTEVGLPISELAQECQLPLSTLHRILQAMIKQGMVEQDAQTKYYRLGTIWLEYGLQVYDTMDYVNKIRPELDRLAKEVDESVYLSKPSGEEAIIIERIDSENNPIRIYDQLGSRIPMHIGAANKAMLAAMPIDRRAEILHGLVSLNGMAPLEAELVKIGQQGYAVSHGERTEGTSSVAVAVLNGFGEVIGAISVGTLTFNLTESRLEFLILQILETGHRVSTKLGYRPNDRR